MEYRPNSRAISLPLNGPEVSPLAVFFRDSLQQKETMSVHLANGTLIDTINPVFLGPLKVITESDRLFLSDSNGEKGIFLVKMLQDVPLCAIKLNDLKFIWFHEIADSYTMDDIIFNHYTKDVCSIILKFGAWKLLNLLIIEREGSFRKCGPRILNLIKEIKKSIIDSDSDDIQLETLTYSCGRKIICEILNVYPFCFGKTETEIFSKIWDLVKKTINVHKLSENGLYDLFACIRWFDVSPQIFQKTEEEIMIFYPDFKITKIMKSNLNLRSKLLSLNDKESFNVPKHTQMIDSRFPFEYEFNFNESNPQDIRIYTTTMEPELLNLSLYAEKKGSDIILHLCLKYSNKKPTINFDIQYTDDIALDVIKNKTWTFFRKLSFKFPTGVKLEKGISIKIVKAFFLSDEEFHEIETKMNLKRQERILKNPPKKNQPRFRGRAYSDSDSD
jgi:hypothetical protein